MCGFYDVSSAQHTACDIFSSNSDGTLSALEQKSFLSVLLSVVLTRVLIASSSMDNKNKRGEISVLLSDEARLKDDIINVTMYCQLGTLHMSVKMSNLANFKILNSV